MLVPVPASSLRIASFGHTARLAAVFLALGAVGIWARLHAGAGGTVGGRANLSLLYASLIVTEWLLFRGVRAGLASTGTDWRALVGRRPRRLGDALLDLLIGASVTAAWVWAAREGGVSARTQALLPVGAVESTLWIVLALSAGFCEEFAFRGYFQRQFAAISGSRAAGIALQAALFGFAHAYQGVHSALAVTAYGLVLGAITHARGSLRSGIVAHTVTDITLGFLGR